MDQLPQPQQSISTKNISIRALEFLFELETVSTILYARKFTTLLQIIEFYNCYISSSF